MSYTLRPDNVIKNKLKAMDKSSLIFRIVMLQDIGHPIHFKAKYMWKGKPINQ